MLRPNRLRPERWRRTACTVTALLWLLTVVGAAGFAQAPAVWQGDIDGVPTWITVIPQGHDISEETRTESPWWSWGNVESDAYLFAFYAPDQVYIALEFERVDEGISEARFYVQDWGETPLAYDLRGTELTILSNGGHPNLRVRPSQGEWLIDGRPNYQLTLWEDGYVEAFRIANVNPTELVPDGRPERLTHVGIDASGDPLWETTDRIHDPHPSWGGNRFDASLRTDNTSEYRVLDPLMPAFPLFGIVNRRIDWFEQNPHPVMYDLRKKEFSTNSFIAFQTGGTYWINSDTYPPNVGFESPFAFYSFLPDTRYAQMVIRAESFPAGSPFGPEPRHTTRTAFRYTWKTFSETLWDYGIHVAGPFPYDQEITIGDRTFLNVAMDDLPTWIADKAWPLVTFVDPVDGYTGSEGIYFYNANDPQHMAWLSGSSREPVAWLAAPYLQATEDLGNLSGRALPPNFRGEFSTRYFRSPSLYLSPVDLRLHLEHAEGGVWNLDQRQVLRYHNLDGDATIDGWTRELVPERIPPPPEVDLEGKLVPPSLEELQPIAAPGTVEAALFTLWGHAIYGAAGSVVIRQTGPLEPILTTAPPIDAESWEAFHSELEPYRNRGGDPFDLRSWLSGLPGPSLELTGAALSLVRRTDEGFVFKLDVDAEVVRRDDAGAPALPELAPGSYVVRYRTADDSWTAVPAQATMPVAEVVHEPMRAYYPAHLDVTLRNAGNVDWLGDVDLLLDGVTIERFARVLVPGEGELLLRPTATSEQAGVGQLQILLDEQPIYQAPLTVAASPRGNPTWLLQLSVRSPFLALLLIATMVMGVVGIRAIWSLS